MAEILEKGFPPFLSFEFYYLESGQIVKMVKLIVKLSGI